MNFLQLRELVVRRVLNAMPSIPYSEQAEDLIMMTIAHESEGGKYIRQLGVSDGIGAYGVTQMEIRTHDDIWENYLLFKDEVAGDILQFQTGTTYLEDMVWNLGYQVAMCRVHYFRVPEALPVHVDKGEEGRNLYLKELAMYAKEHYNTKEGKATWNDYYLKFLEYERKGATNVFTD